MSLSNYCQGWLCGSRLLHWGSVRINRSMIAFFAPKSFLNTKVFSCIGVWGRGPPWTLGVTQAPHPLLHVLWLKVWARSCKRSKTLFQTSLLLILTGESTSTASQKSQDIKKVLLLLQDLE